MLKTITIFCGSSLGKADSFARNARLLGRKLAEEDIDVVYGGAKIGLMGAVADGALQHGGKVTGVLPHFLGSKEIAHQGITELIMVDSMHERKTKMNELCDGVISMPGGFGTMEEFFEMLTWGQLGLHKKPIGLFNVSGFYDPLIEMLKSMVDNGFLKAINYEMVIISGDIDELLDKMKNYQAPDVGKWIRKEQV